MIRPRNWWDRLFVVAIAAKGLDGVVEVLAAIGLLVVTPGRIRSLAAALIAPQLAEDPDDVIAHYLLHSIDAISAHAQVFATVYLFVHGAVKLMLVIALLRNKMWAYPWMMGVLVAFIGYQLYRIALTPTAGLIALTIFDAIIVVLVLHEYRYHRRRTRALQAEEAEPQDAQPQDAQPQDAQPQDAQPQDAGPHEARHPEQDATVDDADARRR